MVVFTSIQIKYFFTKFARKKTMFSNGAKWPMFRPN